MTSSRISRRAFLQSAASAAGALIAERPLAAGAARIPTIDTHIHLFDPTRPGGIPWPTPADPVLYRPALPHRYQQLIEGLDIVGAIAIEASPLAADNDWLLATARSSPLIVGVIGDLVPGSQDFRPKLDRLRADPLFLGLRYGNLWGRNLAQDIDRPGFMDGVGELSREGLVFESANPNAALLRGLAKVATRWPELTIVIDHLPHAEVPSGPAEKLEYDRLLEELSQAPKVFIKLSEIPVATNGAVSTDISSYRGPLDELWQRFGEDKVLFGSDWPNSDSVLPFRATVGILKTYASEKSRTAQEHLFWKNSSKAYKWRPRLADQPRFPAL